MANIQRRYSSISTTRKYIYHDLHNQITWIASPCLYVLCVCSPPKKTVLPQLFYHEMWYKYNTTITLLLR